MLERETPSKRSAPYATLLLGGLPVEDPVLPRGEARARMVAAVESGPAVAAAKSHAQGGHQKNWVMNTQVTFDGPLLLGLVPMARAVHVHQGRRHAFWLEGANLQAEFHVRLPKDSIRSKRKLLGRLPFVLGLVLTGAGLFWHLAGPLGKPVDLSLIMAVLSLALIAWAIRNLFIESHSKRSKAVSLAKMRLEELDKAGVVDDNERRRLFAASRVSTGRLGGKDMDLPFVPALTAIVVLGLVLGFRWKLGEFLGLSSDSPPSARTGAAKSEPATPASRRTRTAPSAARRSEPATSALASNPAGRPHPAPSAAPEPSGRAWLAIPSTISTNHPATGPPVSTPGEGRSPGWSTGTAPGPRDRPFPSPGTPAAVPTGPPSFWGRTVPSRGA
jgi:hypothetical protein